MNNRKKRLIPLLTLCLLAALLSGCSKTESAPSPEAETPSPAAEQIEQAPGTGTITLSGDHIETEGSDLSVNGTTVTVTKGGEYTVRGTLTEGQIRVNTGETAERVSLILDGVSLANREDAAIYVEQCDKLKLILTDGSENVLTSGTESGELSPASKDANGAVIFSEDDLDIEGSGKLRICGYLNNGVTCKDDLTVQGGSMDVVAANNGLRGSESVQIEAGTVNVTAINDGIKATSVKKEGKGFVSVSGGSVTVNAGGDGVDAATELRITGGELSITTTGDPEISSSKGLKAGELILIEGGSFNLDCTDHAIRSSGSMDVRGGSFEISASMGRGFSAQNELSFSGEGTYRINAIEDGLYSDTELTVSGGSFSIIAGEDGLHAGETGTGEGTVTIEGGELLVCAYQDAIDAKQHLLVNGGSVLAVGKSKTLKGFSENSAQPYICADFAAPSRTELFVKGPDGSVLGHVTSPYAFAQVLFSSSALEKGGVYELEAGGNTLRVGA